MADDLLVRPATPEDTGPILDLVRLSLGEGKVPRQVEYWRWKHFENPFGASPALLAFQGPALVGLRVFMRWTWRAGGVDVPAVRAVDTATHPDSRGKGIFTRLTLALLEQMTAEGVAFVFNTPNSRSRPGYLKMGWRSLGRTSVWIRPLSLSRVARPFLSSRGLANEPSNANGGGDIGSSAGALVAEPGFARFVDALPERHDRLATAGSTRYLHWRYVAIPGFDYRAAWALDGRDGAAVIFRTRRSGRLREIRLCQVLIGDSGRSMRMGRDLLRDLARRTEANYVSGMTGAGTRAQRVFLRSGFLPAPRLGPVMTVRPLNVARSRPDPLRRSDWHLSIGDLELF